MRHRLIVRADTTTAWNTVNPVLQRFELVYDRSLRNFKIGDGVKPWKELPYVGGAAAAAVSGGAPAWEPGEQVAGSFVYDTVEKLVYRVQRDIDDSQVRPGLHENDDDYQAVGGMALSATGPLLTYDAATGTFSTQYTAENAANKNVAGGYVGLGLDGTIDPIHIPVIPLGLPVISAGGIADLTLEQRNSSTFSRKIIYTSDGLRWIYTGSGDKLLEANYYKLADITPEWSVIAGKPAFGTGSTYNVPAAGNAAANELVLGSDSRLTDARSTTWALLKGLIPNSTATKAGNYSAADTIEELFQRARYFFKNVDAGTVAALVPENLAPAPGQTLGTVLGRLWGMLTAKPNIGDGSITSTTDTWSASRIHTSLNTAQLTVLNFKTGDTVRRICFFAKVVLDTFRFATGGNNYTFALVLNDGTATGTVVASGSTIGNLNVYIASASLTPAQVAAGYEVQVTYTGASATATAQLKSFLLTS